MNRRLFIGIEIPENIKQEISAIQSKLNVKWQRPENLHITITFLGGIAEEKIEHLKKELTKVSSENFYLRIKGTGFFKDRALWCGVRKTDEIILLKNMIDAAVKDSGIVFDGKEFIPHVTIARIRKSLSKSDIDNYLQKTAKFSCKKFLVESFALFESITFDGQTRYEVLNRFNLSGA